MALSVAIQQPVARRTIVDVIRRLNSEQVIARWIYSCGMEPGEKFIRRLLKFVLMILAIIVSIVFGEFYRGMGWVGALIFIIGALMGALGTYLLKSLRD
jgi:hypothetical protein